MLGLLAIREIKIKPQWGFILPQSEWLTSENQRTKNIGEDVGKRHSIV